MSALRSLDVQTVLRDLVSLPSVSPEGDSAGTLTGEKAVADYASALLGKLGADVSVKDVEPGRPNVLAVFEPAGPATATVALVPHLDTVGVAGMTVPPFTLTRRHGRLYGRGSCDTKGPFAALLSALGAWVQSPARKRSHTRWVVVATMDEETGGIGAKAFIADGFLPDFAIALEPTGLKVVHANKGVLRVWLETTGRAAHGSTPEAGRNAIYPLLPFAAAVERSLPRKLARRPHPLLGPATVNLGVIAGGQELNIVPDRCRVGLDIRTHPQCDNAHVLNLLDTLRRKLAPQASLQLFRDGPSYVTPRTHPWARRLRRCGSGWAVANWFCDANHFAAAGVPAVAFGPGSIAQAHTRDEFITERALADGVQAFRKLLALA
jgi:acetylornithine deacetylase/succinyl-diaminopimelate desuccinylase-like protein